MNLISWNIQSCRGCDGRVDPQRIVDVCRGMADFDVLCFQEVARNFPDLPGSSGEDQFALLAGMLPGFTALEGIATDLLGANGKRRQFGNLTLTRYPVVQAFAHLLPWPADPAVPSMQRAAVEARLGRMYAGADAADLGDLAVLDADIAAKARQSGTIDDHAVLDD